jgi:hypothetical protein
MDQNKPLLDGIILWMSAISLFIFGHIIEGNLRAMTVVIIYKYLKSLLEN